ncbi:DUF885 domain-containing protein [Pseudonocardia kujensis]|uniref:DUF885 domain-containing protein n=1 Tax=Pseudonocardia kujensis TaxID=1128675 RepID=UPI001E391999|nr:DUF885 domain-containing protein [Pseudonocardia kujensis]MCE0768193.1 DUF885 domain-containing protein [Pseudonocardia kujensis]
MKADAVAREVALVALRLDRLAPGTVEAFDGDPALRRHARADAVPVPSVLVREAVRLRRALPYLGLPPVRETFLDGELRALERTARGLAGEQVALRTEIRETYGVDVAPGDPDRYRAAHRALDALLPGRAPLADRLAAYRARDELPGGLRGPAIRALVAALRQRTAALLDLPAGEEVEIELVEGRPWSGFTRHLGRGRSLARFSTDAPQRAGQLARLVAHETYPGHHVEHLRRAATARSEPERALSLTRSPRALVVEGVADLGLDAVVGPGWGPWAAEVLAGVGVVTDGELAEALEEAMLPLQHVRLDAALLVERAGPAAARDHLRRWLLLDGARADRALRFLTDPRWRAYTVTYVVGYPLVRAWWAGDLARFRRALDRPVTPAVLASPAAADWSGRSAADRGAPATDGVDHAMSGRPFC